MITLSVNIQFLEVGAAPKVLAGHDFHQAQHLAVEVVAFAIQMMKQRINRVEIRPQPRIEMAQVALSNIGLELIQDPVEQGV